MFFSEHSVEYFEYFCRMTSKSILIIFELYRFKVGTFFHRCNIIFYSLKFFYESFHELWIIVVLEKYGFMWYFSESVHDWNCQRPRFHLSSQLSLEFPLDKVDSDWCGTQWKDRTLVQCTCSEGDTKMLLLVWVSSPILSVVAASSKTSSRYIQTTRTTFRLSLRRMHLQSTLFLNVTDTYSLWQRQSLS